MRLDHLPAAVCIQSLDRRRLERDAGRRRRIIGLRVRIFHPSRQAEPERLVRAVSAQPISEIEDDSVFLGIADPAAQLAEVVDRAAIPEPQSSR